MSANFYELLKYAATGQASPSMTYFDKMRASTLMGGGAVQTLTGIPPLSFKSDGTPLISWSMKGNGSQTGTPAPDNPVMPTFCGVRTGNLFDSAVYELVPVSASAQRKGTNLGVLPQGTYTFNAASAASPTPIYRTIKNGSAYSFEAINSLPYTFTADGASEQIIRTSGTQGNTWADAGYSNIMLNSGSTALPYEPYGYKLPLTVNGVEYPIYLGTVPSTRRIGNIVLDGTGGEITQSGRYRIYLTNQLKGIAPICTHYIGSNAVAYVSLHDGHVSVSIQAYLTIYDSRFTTIDEYMEFFSSQYAAGTPVTVWYVLAEPETGIVNEPLAKIGDYADELHSEDAGVTIPTVKGNNTLTVDTPIPPSEMTITYKG